MQFEYEAAPMISYLSPSKGLASGGTLVTVVGSKLAMAAGTVVVCTFGGAEAVAIAVNSTALVCTAPRNAQAGVVGFGVKRSREANVIGGVLQYEYYSAPVGEYIWPVKGPLAGGMLGSVHGRGFAAEGLVCRFGSDGMGMGKLVSSTMAACSVPARASTGVVAVGLSLNGGVDFTDLGREFTYEMGATIEVLRPSRGESGVEGQVVTIAGQHFRTSGQPRCRFGQDQTVQGGSCRRL